jgi:hypothetical protein
MRQWRLKAISPEVYPPGTMEARALIVGQMWWRCLLTWHKLQAKQIDRGLKMDCPQALSQKKVKCM